MIKRGHHIMLCIFAIITTLVVFFSYLYMNKIINNSVLRTVEQRSIVDSEKSGKSKEQVLIKTYNDTEQDRASITKMFIPSEKAVIFIEALESLSTKVAAKVTISGTETENMDNSSLVQMGGIHAHIDAQGAWSEVMKTLRLVETMPFLVTIDRLQLVASNLPSVNKKAPKTEWKLSFDVRSPMINIK